MGRLADFEHPQLLPVIKGFAFMNQYLISEYINYGLIEEVIELKNIDYQLTKFLEHKNSDFDFTKEISAGKTLLVGEGNLSFTLSLLSRDVIPWKLIATVFESIEELSEDASENKDKLRNAGVNVIAGVDATNLYSHFYDMKFDNIIFQFPNAASREGVEGFNPNHVLLRNFLISANKQLFPSGQVIVSIVDSTYYRGAFQVDEAAEVAGFLQPLVYEFNPSAFQCYEHTMTHQAGNALDNHDSFITLVFKKA